MPEVLVVDDDPDIRMLVVFALEDSGFAVRQADDGASALAALAVKAPDAMVLDVMMPGLNGFEVVQQLRQSEETRDIPVILLTATVQEKDISKGFEAGADDYMRKPFNPQELQARVKALLRRRTGSG